MLRNILLSREMLTGLVFCILIVGGAVLYHEHVKHSSSEALRQTQQTVRDIKTFQPKSVSTSTPQRKEQSDATPDEDGSERPVLGSAEQDNTSNAPLEPSSEETINSEIQEEIIAEEGEAPETLSPEELRRQELLQRKADLYERLHTLSPVGHTVHSADEPETMRQVLEVTEELVHIEEELNGYSDPEAHFHFRLSKFMTNIRLDSDGNLPFSGAEKMAAFFENEGKRDVADRLRLVIQNARKNGDEIIKKEHVMGLE